MCMAISAHFLRTSAEKKGVRMSAVKKRLKVSPRGIVAGSFLIKKKKSSPCGPYFPGTFHSMGAVLKYTHTIPRVQVGPNVLPDRLLPQTLKVDCASHWRPHPPQGLGPRNTLARTLHALQRFIQCHNRVFEVLFPQFQSRFLSS